MADGPLVVLRFVRLMLFRTIHNIALMDDRERAGHNLIRKGAGRLLRGRPLAKPIALFANHTVSLAGLADVLADKRLVRLIRGKRRTCDPRCASV